MQYYSLLCWYILVWWPRVGYFNLPTICLNSVTLLLCKGRVSMTNDNINGSGYPFIKSMVFITPKNDSCVTMDTWKSDECWSFDVFLCFLVWEMIGLHCWNCHDNVPWRSLHLGYGCIITLKATAASISDGLPYLPYLTRQVNATR